MIKELERRKHKTYLTEAVLLEVLLLDGGAKVESGVVNEIGRVLGQIQHHEIKVQPHNTTTQQQPKI